MTYIKVPKVSGSTCQKINVSNGKPVGALWTWPNTCKETHPWHAKPLNGEHKAFYGRNGLKLAKQYIEQFA